VDVVLVLKNVKENRKCNQEWTI